MENESHQRRKIPLILLVLGILLILVISLYFIFRENPNSKELVLFGNVDVRQVNIGFRVPGKVAQLFFEEGDVVPKGSLMAVLDKTPYDSQIAQAKANVDSVAANLENAQILLKRRQQALKIGGVSNEDVDEAHSSQSAFQANLFAADAALAVAKENMNYTEVYAPTDGILLSRIREPGTVVNPADPVYILSVSSPVWIRAFVNEPQLGSIYYGMQAEILTDGGRNYTGQIGFISPVAEFTPKTVETTQLRTDLVYRLRIYADNPDHFLKQGMPVTVKLHREKKEKT